MPLLYNPADQCKVVIICALGLDKAIGEKGAMPWYLPEDLKHFKATTAGSCVIMGLRTYKSIGKPLPKRRNIVVTSHPQDLPQSVTVAVSLAEAIAIAHAPETMTGMIGNGMGANGEGMGVVDSTLGEPQPLSYDHIYLIGGSAIFNEGLGLCDELVLTEIGARFPDADTFFPQVDLQKDFTLVSTEPAASYFSSPAPQPESFAQVIEPSLKENQVQSGLPYRFLRYQRAK